MKRIFTFMLALVSAFTLAGIVLEVNAKQISSDKENVYFNEYGQKMGRSINFDDNWRFYFGDAQGAQDKTYDDSKWRNINLPHDYSIEQEFSRGNGNEGESGYLGGGVGWYRKSFRLDEGFFKGNVRARIDFDGVYMDSTVYINGTELGNHPYGYTPFSFDITKYLERGENVISVRVNHQTPSSRWYSGSGIYRSVHLTLVNDVHVDLFGSKIQTPTLNAETKNNVTVEAETEVRNATGLKKSVNIEYQIVEREKDGSEGRTILTYVKPGATEIPANTTATIKSSFEVENPKLWSVDTPNLYYVKTKVSTDGAMVDLYKEQFGFRYFNFDPNLGFSLNGERMKLKGVSMHHDQGSLGAVANKDAQERQIRILKEMGSNAIRVTHNPASQTLIDAANEMGILLIEEAFDGWDKLKNSNRNDYHRFFNKTIEESNKIYGKENVNVWHEFDLKMQIKRGINSPAIIAWSLGNEIWEGISGKHSNWPQIHREMVEFVKRFDTTRPVTTGDNKLKEWQNSTNSLGNPNSIQIGNQNAEAGGIVGFNYASGANMDHYHSKYPNWPMYGAETSSAVNSRGVYYEQHKNTGNSAFELTSYDESAVGWGLKSSESWHIIQKRDYVAGEFIWTGFDYIGEPTEWNDPYGTLGKWPAPKNSYFGIIDTAGLPKDRYYFYQSQWRKDITTLHVLPAWDKDALKVNDGQNVRVDVYSNAHMVKLFLDKNDGTGKKLVGTSTMKEFKSNATINGNGDGYYTYMAREDGSSHKHLYHTFNVAYNDGTLTAEAYDSEGRLIENTSGIKKHTTASKAYQIKATVEKEYNTIDATGDSLAYIRLDVVDSNGNIVPTANNLIRTTVTGAGRFLSMDNGHQADLTKYSTPERRVYNGSGIAIVGSLNQAGKMTVEFTSPGLKSASVEITTTKASMGDSTINAIGLSLSRNYFIKKDSKVNLPTTVDVLFSDGHKESKNVEWKNLGEQDFSTVGVKTINGIVDGKYKVSVNVNVIDKIGGVYTYTAASRLGEIPTLPEKLEAYDDKGESLGLFLDIKWEMPTLGAFERLGEIKIRGTASFLDQEVVTYATISIRETHKSYDNIAPEAMNKTEDHKNNDNFGAMFNKNPSTDAGYWTNFDRSTKLNDKDSIITLEYATQAQVGKAAITFFKDSYSVVYPRIDDLVIEYLENGESEGIEWKKVEYTSTMGAEKTSNGKSYKTYTYNFQKPIGVTLIRFVINNHPTDHTPKFQMAVSGITEIEVFGLNETMVVGKEAKLSALNINGYSLTEEELAKGSFNVNYSAANITAKGKDNAAVTVLPAKAGKVRIKVVSEDKLKESEFIINLNKAEGLDPSYSGADYNSYAAINAPKEQNASLAVAMMNDNNNGTYYHSSWARENWLDLTKNSVGIELDLGKEVEIQALRYLPRQGEDDNAGSRNGRITKYEIWVMAEGGQYERVANGSWANNQSWKIAEFSSRLVRKIKLVAKETFAANSAEASQYINVAEIRVVETSRIQRQTIENVTVEIEPTATHTNPMLTVKNGETLLNRGHDYVVSFALVNGRGQATIKGINNYSGEKVVAFDLVSGLAISKVTITNLSLEPIIGDVITINDIILKVSYSNGSEFTIVDPINLGNRLVLKDGFNHGLANGENLLSFTLDGYSYTNSLYATRGNLDKALAEAVESFEVNLAGYEEANKPVYKEKLARVKAMQNEGSLRRVEVAKAIKELEAAYNSLVKKPSFINAEAKASLVISYQEETLELGSLKLRFGGRIENSSLDLENKNYGVIILATADKALIDPMSGITVEKLNELKARGFANDIKPVAVEGKSYSQFAWVIPNIPADKYDFSFTAYLYEVDKQGTSVVLSKGKTASVMDVVNTYLANATELALPKDVIAVLEKIGK